MKKEEWRQIEGFPMYQVSNLGRVKSAHAYSGGSLSTVCDKNGYRIIKGSIFTRGYRVVSLSENKTNKKFLLHRLVAKAFILNPENKREVNHKNGIKTDNRVENLEWVTAKENARHAFDTGLKIGQRGSKSPNAKLNEHQVRRIKLMLEIGGVTYRKIGILFGVKIGTIMSIKSGQNWKHITA